MIETLLEAANSASEGDTSLNLAKGQLSEEQAAGEVFEITRARLLQIEEWKKNSTVTDYDLFSGRGDPMNGEEIEVGSLIRIALYGSGKYDWVRVQSIINDPEEFVITVKPSHDSTATPPDPASISHFFGPQASNNLCLQLNEKTVALVCHRP